MILGLCRKYHCLPSQLLAEDASFLKMIMIENMGTPEQQEEDNYDD